MLSVHASQISIEKINLNAVYTIDNRWKGNRNKIEISDKIKSKNNNIIIINVKGFSSSIKSKDTQTESFWVFLSLYLTEKDQRVNGTEVLTEVFKWQKYII